MSAEENKAIMQHFWKELLNEGKTEKANEFVADDYVYHAPGDHEIKGIEGFKKFMTWIHSSFPGVQFTIEDLIAEEDKVVSLFTMKSKHKSNKQVNFKGIVICRIASGKEVEVWEIFDRFTIASQLAPGWAKAILGLIEKQMSKDRP